MQVNSETRAFLTPCRVLSLAATLLKLSQHWFQNIDLTAKWFLTRGIYKHLGYLAHCCYQYKLSALTNTGDP